MWDSRQRQRQAHKPFFLNKRLNLGHSFKQSLQLCGMVSRHLRNVLQQTNVGFRAFVLCFLKIFKQDLHFCGMVSSDLCSYMQLYIRISYIHISYMTHLESRRRRWENVSYRHVFHISYINISYIHISYIHISFVHILYTHISRMTHLECFIQTGLTHFTHTHLIHTHFIRTHLIHTHFIHTHFPHDPPREKAASEYVSHTHLYIFHEWPV